MADPVNRLPCASVAVAVVIMAGVAACGSITRKADSAASTVRQAHITSAQLKSALLARFKQARTLPDDKTGARLSVVLAPSRANDTAAQRSGAADPPISDPRCRLWAAGVWSEAVHTSGLAVSSKAAVASLYGLYGIPKSHSADEPLMSISEAILSVSASQAVRLAGEPMPRACRRVRIYGKPAVNAPGVWMTTRAYPIKVAPLGDDTHAERGIVQNGQREIWTEWFRLNSYVVEVGVIGAAAVRFPSTLELLARAAYRRAAAEPIPTTSGPTG